ncbi:NADPH2:quinone reductase [Paractinoplanes atraurantiacus]|uniref:NADPH2:quinone reductase n=2 Tax=Paractinoplanes atraurantiacus TaxID=1036182 RepID=A0A285I4C7_9ACTN|nr:NADPH2:quinone reductase [Actinoplanes atraurantiacus]
MHVAAAGSGRGAAGTPRHDGAGVVDAVGPDVDGLTAGDFVWVWNASGTAREYLILPRRNVVPLPPGVSFDVGASLGVPALTAHRALTAAAGEPTRLVPGALTGRVVLVAGAAGPAENATIQLASWAGAHVVVAVSSPAEAESARAAGADHVRLPPPPGGGVLPPAADRAGLPGSPDGAALPESAESAPFPEPPDIVADLAAAADMTPDQQDEAVASVTAAAAAHRLRVGAEAGLPITRFPLAQVAAAYETAERHPTGKVLIDI